MLINPSSWLRVSPASTLWYSNLLFARGVSGLGNLEIRGLLLEVPELLDTIGVGIGATI